MALCLTRCDPADLALPSKTCYCAASCLDLLPPHLLCLIPHALIPPHTICSSPAHSLSKYMLMLRLERLSRSWAINTCTATSFGSTRRQVGILRLMLPQEAIAAGAPMLPFQNSKDSVSVHSASTRLLTCCTHKVPQALSLQECPTTLLTPAPPFISFRACLLCPPSSWHALQDRETKTPAPRHTVVVLGITTLDF